MTVPAPFAHCLPVAGERPRKMPTVHPRTWEAKGRAARNRDRAVVLYRLGMSIREIAEIQRVGAKKVRAGLVAAGVTLRPSGGSYPEQRRRLS